MEWKERDILPEVNRNVVIMFINDIGYYYAAGLTCETSDTHEIVFADVLAGHIYDWQETVIKWAYI